MDTNESLPVDDVRGDGPTEQELLDAVLRNSPIMEEAGVPLPEEEVLDEDPVESEAVEDPESDEIDTEETEEEYDEEEVEAADEDDSSTQEADVFTADDLDLDARVAVKIDGEEVEVSFGDLIKGYTTEQSLSKKGRELGEARKALDEERQEKLGQLDAVAQASAQLLLGPEQAAAKEYHEIEAKIKEARDNGDTFELNELKDKKEQAQERYWQSRRQRESMLTEVEKQKQELMEQEWQKQIDHFNETIPTLIEDYTPEVASSIREFALNEGIDPTILDTITDPTIVKFVDDYRRLKQGVSKGAAKRKAAPVKKVPAKKARTPQKKQEDKSKALRSKVLSGQGNKRDEDAFLKEFASRSLGNL